MTASITVLLLFCLVISSRAQSNIKGRIMDDHQRLPAATVLLLTPDSTLVKGAVANDNGEFIFNQVSPGHYMISAWMIGYTKFFSKSFKVTNDELMLPDIILEEVTTSLSEVTIEAEKPLYESQIDRLVVNVGNSITSSGNTVLEVLQKSPGVVVNRQNNSITMNAKSGVRIMINGKLLQMPLDVAVQMLDGMSAANVEKIELITTPPAAFDAEGNAGIIHIVTKQQEDLGTSGSLGLTAGARWAETFGGNFSLHHRSRKVSYFIDYSVLRTHNLHRVRMNRRSELDGFVQIIHDESHRENVTTQQNFNGGLEWKAGKNTVLNFLLNGYRRNWDLNAHSSNTFLVRADSTVITAMDIHESNIWESGTASIGMLTKINSKSELSVNGDYLYYHNNNPSTYAGQARYEEDQVTQPFGIDLSKTTPIHFFVGKADYRHNISSSMALEAGAKVVASLLDNNVRVQRNVDGTWTTDPVFTSYSTLHEKIGASYFSFKWQPVDSWQINSGLRYEYTQTRISTPAQRDLVKRQYGFIFPSFFVKRNLAPERDIQFSYSRRITRPTYNDIAPFVFFWSPNTFTAGNTSLFPAIVNTVSAGYHERQWFVSLQLSHSRNEIAFLQPEIDGESNLIYRSQNLEYLNTASLTNAYMITLNRWWDVQTTVTAQYQHASTKHLPQDLVVRLYGVNVSIVNMIRLPKDFVVEVSGVYQSKSLFGISEFLPFGSLNAGVQKKLGKKAILRLSVDDALNTNNWRIRTTSGENNLDSYFRYHWYNRYLRLTYTRTLGNSQLRSVNLRSGSEEERGRVNN